MHSRQCITRLRWLLKFHSFISFFIHLFVKYALITFHLPDMAKGPVFKNLSNMILVSLEAFMVADAKNESDTYIIANCDKR